MVARNLATRWDEEHPAVGVDPDVCLVEPPPPDRASLTSLRLWEAGHHAPLVAIEVVSPKHPYKDYAVAPEKYAASGTGELWIFDPDLAGPQALGGPHRIQLWVRDEADQFTRVYAGEGPVQSPAVGGWLFAVNEGSRLRLADDPDGRSWWMTGEEAERTAKDAALAAKDAARAEAEAERAAKKAALARVAELEAELGHRKR
jgi:Uma2 family endonuclease